MDVLCDFPKESASLDKKFFLYRRGKRATYYFWLEQELLHVTKQHEIS